jgi:energy-coupling factor transporter transmembrane protein EcfT
MTKYSGAGGTKGGTGNFFIGLIMFCSGSYLLLQSIIVSSSFNLGFALYTVNSRFSQIPITNGMILIPFIFGIGMIFYNARSFLGWLLTCCSLAALIFGVISSLHISLRTMTAFELLTILVLTFGGLGLFLKSIREY